MSKWVYKKVPSTVSRDYLQDLCMDGWIFIGPDMRGALCFKHRMEEVPNAR